VPRSVIRGVIRVREAAATDIPTIIALGEELRQAGTTQRGVPVLPVPSPSRTTLEMRYAEVLTDARSRVVLAVGESDETLGMAVLTRTSADPRVDIPAVQMSHVVVANRYRRKGAGRALVAAAAAYAEEVGLEQVVVGVHPGSREVNRFYARLGFAPLVMRRVASVSALRRRLAASELRPGPGLRRRATTRPLPLRRAALATAGAELASLTPLRFDPLAEL
jgi:GNAT superfamily N-acetyltransferase